MAKAEHYKKKGERENKTRLLALLKQHGDLGFSQLKGLLRVSGPTLSDYITDLEKDNRIEAKFSSKDRRLKRYRIKPESMERVEAQIRSYEAIKFIEGMDNPTHTYEEINGKAIAVFVSGAYASKSLLKIQTKAWLKIVNVPQFPNVKTAIVIMIKGKERV